MKESKEETKLQSEQKTLQAFCEFLEANGYTDSDWRDESPTAIDRFLKSQLPIEQKHSWTEHFAYEQQQEIWKGVVQIAQSGPASPVRELQSKFTIISKDSAIEQKESAYNQVITNQCAEIESLKKDVDKWRIAAAEAWERKESEITHEVESRLKSQPSPIEGVEREQFSIEDMKAAFEAGRDHEWAADFGRTKDYEASKFSEWLATRKGK